MHLHKNTVKYRVDKAAEMRGRAIDEERLSLEIFDRLLPQPSSPAENMVAMAKATRISEAEA